MLTVKTVDRYGNESVYEADEVARITPNGSSAARPGVLIQKDSALVMHVELSGEEPDDANCSADTVAAYVMNSSGATVAIYRAERASQSALRCSA